MPTPLQRSLAKQVGAPWYEFSTDQVAESAALCSMMDYDTLRSHVHWLVGDLRHGYGDSRGIMAELYHARIALGVRRYYRRRS